MIKSSHTLLVLLSSLTPLLFTACSTHNVVAVSDPHYYSQDFGLLPDPQADAQLHQEHIIMSQPTQIDMPMITDPDISTELVKDPDAFYAHEYVEAEPVISYKYPFDSKFYSNAEWRTFEFD